MSADLTSTTVVVAGATGAAGPAVVRALALAGAHVVAAGHDPRRVDALVADTRAALEATGAPAAGGVEGAVIDLLDAAAVRAWAQGLLADRGHVDGLVHLVGGWRGGDGIAVSDPADWMWLHDRLVVTLQNTTRAFHDALVASGGHLAVVSTTQASAPTATNAAYAAAKAAADAWVLAVADSFAQAGGGASATIFVIKALLTDAMRQERPDRRFPGYTHVDDLAQHVVGLWGESSRGVGATRQNLVS